jgi:acylphosphatase
VRVSGRVARRLVIHGHVQGVFFRDSLREQAERHGVAGWARNRSDGTVHAHLEGDAQAVDRVEAFAREGPPRAHVTQVEASDAQPEELSGFAIR